MSNLINYLTSTNILVSVTVPWLFVVWWFIFEVRKNPPNLEILIGWVFFTLCTLFLTRWEISDHEIKLFMIDLFFFYLLCYIFNKKEITSTSSFCLTFLSIWIIDITKANELILLNLVDKETFYYGVGGAGLFDGLAIIPIVAAAIINYDKSNISFCIRRHIINTSSENARSITSV